MRSTPLVRMLDSCIAIDIIRHVPYYTDKFLDLPPATCAISMISYVELMGGLVHRPGRERERRTHEFLRLVHVLDFDRAAGDAAAKVRGMLAAAGQTTGDFDEAIAGHAKACGLILVSKDSDFIHALTLESLVRVEPWLSPEDAAKRKRKPR